MSKSNTKPYAEMTAGERIRAKRKMWGWTIDDLARESGVNRADISQIENGGPFGAQRALKISRALDMKLEAIWTLPGSTPKQAAN